MSSGSDIPLWDLSPVYRGFDDPAFTADKQKLKDLLLKLEEILDGGGGNNEGFRVRKYIELYNVIQDTAENLSSFAYALFSVNTGDNRALKEIDAVDELMVPMKGYQTRFRDLLSAVSISSMIEEEPFLADYRFFLEEELVRQKHQMSREEEELAADLSRSGGEAWSRLQDALSSQIKLTWDADTKEEKTVIELRNLAFHSDRAVREKAFTLELSGWESMKTPLAFALNGVKGFSITLNRRRSFSSVLERSILQSRITERTLSSLIDTLRGSLPGFREYLKAKAALLGIQRCAFFDIFAPVGTSERKWGFSEAREIILESFSSFSKDMADFAASVFDRRWIDAKPRPGKVGGAYCTDMPLVGESRILSNFNGTFSAVKTLAHEIGHAYHHHVIREDSHIHRSYPMVLAETASIFAETLLTEKALSILPAAERITIVESMLQDETQVIVDILSRFIFEQAVFDRRPGGDLSAEEFCELMTDAQKQTYGEGLDEACLHPYMWAVKSHYYRQDLAFYNFPYAFGLLFGLGLIARFRQEGPGFARTYADILARTGRMSAVDVARSAGFDIETGDFWQQGMNTVKEHIASFLELAGKNST